MKVIVFQGSPRKNGNCDILVDEIINSAEENGVEIVKYFLDDLNIEPCHACEHCGDGIDCKVDDDGAKLISEMLDADAFVFASPIYYGQMSAQLKTFTDRFYSISRNPQKSLEGKKAILIFTYGAPDGVYDQYIEATKNSPFGHVGMDVVDILAVGGIQPAGAVKELVDVISKAKEIGSNL